jgi:hypothetical protein
MAREITEQIREEWRRGKCERVMGETLVSVNYFYDGDYNCQSFNFADRNGRWHGCQYPAVLIGGE